MCPLSAYLAVVSRNDLTPLESREKGAADTENNKTQR